MNNNELLNFHLEHKYYALVLKEKKGCSIAYPPNVLVRPATEQVIGVYQVIRNEVQYAQSDGFKNKIKINKYDTRLTILTDIGLKLKSRDISNKLVVCFDGNVEKKGIFSILEEFEPKGELKIKEDLLKSKYQAILTGQYSLAEAKKDELELGFVTLTKIIESGGL